MSELMTTETCKNLCYSKKNVFAESDALRLAEIQNYGERYKAFLDAAKTEREAVKFAVNAAKEAGYSEYVFGEALKVGDKKFYDNRGKNLFLFSIGSDPLENDGIRILASHIDAPRLDLKQNPLYENGNMAFLKTHYYGGIKKYQWTAIPLAIHGVIVRADGKTIDVKIGENENDPIFYINDLLPHLAQSQMHESGDSIVKGEQLNILIGGSPLPNCKEKNAIVLHVLGLLNREFGICEEDFISAELSLVPAFRARDIGFDRALIGAYGHDDRVCAFPSLTAMLESDHGAHTCMTVLADKEEIGSEGVSGMQCDLLTDLINEISIAFHANPAAVRARSRCISADVTAAFDPNFESVFDTSNVAKLSEGVCMSKYTGARGKSSSNDASAELIGLLRRNFSDDGVVWQTGELGKVDIGGGGTVAKYVAKHNVETVDMGVPVISMHAPYEVISKADVYSAYEAFRSFLCHE